MTTATLTAKGQTTIPKTVRNHLGLKSGDRLDFVIEPDGGVTIRPINVDARSLAGLLADRYKGSPVSIEEMDRAIIEQVSRENP